jgi:hypothetical protein
VDQENIPVTNFTSRLCCGSEYKGFGWIRIRKKISDSDPDTVVELKILGIIADQTLER